MSSGLSDSGQAHRTAIADGCARGAVLFGGGALGVWQRVIC